MRRPVVKEETLNLMRQRQKAGDWSFERIGDLCS